MAIEGTDAATRAQHAFIARAVQQYGRALFPMVAALVLACSVAGSSVAPATAAVATLPSGQPDATPSNEPVLLAAPVVSAVAATPAAATAAPTFGLIPTPAAATSAQAPIVRESFVAQGTEPSVAADPFHAGVVAVASENIITLASGRNCSRPAVRISEDGGATWGGAVYPWGGLCYDVHAVVAWGPGSRLWAGNAVGAAGGLAMSVTHSDDLGKTWSRAFVETFTRAWVGCYPAISVDNWPGSPNFGTVYVAYNWLAGDDGVGVSLMASRDGTTWVHTDVPVTPLAGYPYSWRIGYRISAAPNGTAYVSFYESSLKDWDSDDLFNEGGRSNIGRLGFEVALVHFDGQNLSADRPIWATSVDHTKAQWQSGLAVDYLGRAWLAVETEGRVSLGRLDGAWTSFSIPGQTSSKPSVAVSGRTVFIGWHAVDAAGRVRTYYSLSHDAGETFLPPALVTTVSWSLRAADVTNGVGLRENADFCNGVVYYAYGDARSQLGVYLAQIQT